jgi:hypothetical protein
MSSTESEPIEVDDDDAVNVRCAIQEERFRVETDGEITHCPGCGRGVRR